MQSHDKEGWETVSLMFPELEDKPAKIPIFIKHIYPVCQNSTVFSTYPQRAAEQSILIMNVFLSFS